MTSPFITGWCLALSVVTLGFAAEVSTPQEKSFTLEGVFADLAGPLPGVKVTVSGAGRDLSFTTTDSGSFLVELLPGTYDFTFHLSEMGQYDLHLTQVYLPRKPAEPWHVIFPTFVWGKHASSRPPRVDAPSIRIAFVPEKALGQGDILRGRIVLQNRGSETIEVPVKPLEESQSYPDDLKMNLTVSLPGANSNAWFACYPARDCKLLEPGEMISFEFTLFVKGEPDKPMVVGETGIWQVRAGLSFVLPSGAQTEAIKERFEIVVP